MEIICSILLIFGVCWLILGFRCDFQGRRWKNNSPTSETPQFPWATLFFMEKLRQIIIFGVWGRYFTLNSVMRKNLPFGVFIILSWDTDTPKQPDPGFILGIHLLNTQKAIFMLDLLFRALICSLSSPPSAHSSHFHLQNLPVFVCAASSSSTGHKFPFSGAFWQGFNNL